MTHRTCSHTLVFDPPMARSALGSLSEGAGSPNGLTEGVCYVEWYAPLVSTAPCRGRQLGDPKPTQLRSSLNGNDQRLLSSWLPPGGSCHDEISASRNRYFVVTDEGWRWLKVLDFPVEWRKQEHMPSIQLHSKTSLSPPLISLFCQSVPKRRLSKNPASPRGKPRNSEDFTEYHLSKRFVA